MPASRLRIPPLDSGAHPPGGVANQFSSLPWRFSFLDLPHNVPMGPFHCVLGLSIAFMKLFCCQFGLHLDSFCHSSIGHYLDGFHIRPILNGFMNPMREHPCALIDFCSDPSHTSRSHCSDMASCLIPTIGNSSHLQPSS